MSLTPEYRNALNVIDNAISLQLFTSSGYEIPSNLMLEGSIFLIKRDFKSRNIPSGKHWRWNQVKSRFQALLPKSKVMVEFYKLTPRSIIKTQKIPRSPYKIWRFDVFDSSRSNVKYRMIWCEKGIKDNDTIFLEDLQFLAHFMDPNVAKEIWPNN